MQKFLSILAFPKNLTPIFNFATLQYALWIVGGLGIFFGIDPLVAAGMKLRFLGMMVFALGTLVATFRQLWKTKQLSGDGLDILLIAVTFYTVLGAFWATDTDAVFITFIQLWPVLGVFWAFRYHGEKLISSNLWLYGAIAAIAYYTAIYLIWPTSNGGLGNKLFFAEAMLTLLAVAVSLLWLKNGLSKQHMLYLRLLAVALFAATLFVLLYNDPSRLEFFILGVMGLYILLRLPAGKVKAPLTFLKNAALVVVAVVGCIAIYPYVEGLDSIRNRLPIWLSIGDQWWEASLLEKLFGFGAGAANTLYHLKQWIYLDWVSDPFFHDMPIRGADSLGQVHNEWLQSAFEIGLVPTLCIVGILTHVVFSFLGRRDKTPIDEAAAFAVVVIAGTAFVQFPFQLPITATIFAAGVGILARREAYSFPLKWQISLPDAYPRFVIAGILSLLAAVLLVAHVQYWRAGRLLATYQVAANSDLAEEKSPEILYLASEASFQQFPMSELVRRTMYISAVDWFLDEVRTQGVFAGFGNPVFATGYLEYLFDAAYKVSPYNPSLQMAYLRYHIATSGNKDPEVTERIEGFLQNMRDNHTSSFDTWLMEMQWGMVIDDFGRALSADEKLTEIYNNLAQDPTPAEHVLVVGALPKAVEHWQKLQVNLEKRLASKMEKAMGSAQGAQ